MRPEATKTENTCKIILQNVKNVPIESKKKRAFLRLFTNLFRFFLGFYSNSISAQKKNLTLQCTFYIMHCKSYAWMNFVS